MAACQYDYDEKSGLPLLHLTYILNNFLPLRHCKQTIAEDAERQLTDVYQQEYLYGGDKDMKVILTGSSFEGLFIPPYFFMDPKGFQPSVLASSDADVMIEVCHKTIGYVDDISSSNTLHCFIETDGDAIHPGYLRLRLANPSKSHEDYKVRKDELSEDFYLLSQTITDSATKEAVKLISERDPGFLKEYAFENQGPALTYFATTEVSLKQKITRSRDFDHVVSLPCPKWPKVAVEWIDRDRPACWPSQALIYEILKEGCHAVPVGHRNSSWKEVEWRFSFSVAEKILVKSLNDTQRHCYKIVKILHKFALQEPKVICSYHLKTVLLRLCEKEKDVRWTEDNMAACLFRMLDEIASVLSAGKLSHYFIPQNNLIDHIPKETLAAFTNNFATVRSNPMKVLFEFNKKYKFGFSPLMLPLEVLLEPMTQEIALFVSKEAVGSVSQVKIRCNEILVHVHLKERRYGEVLEILQEIYHLLIVESSLPKDMTLPNYLFIRSSRLQNVTQMQELMERIVDLFDVTPSLMSNYACICFASSREQHGEEDAKILERKANDAFQKAISITRKSGSICEPPIWTDYANFLCNTERYSDAIPLLLEVVELERNKREPSGGNCYGASERKTVDTRIQEEIDANNGSFVIPSVVYCFYLIVKAYSSLQDKTLGAAMVEKFMCLCKDLKNTTPQIFSLLGYSCMDIEKYSLASEQFGRVLDMDQNSATAINNKDECEAFVLSFTCLNIGD